MKRLLFAIIFGLLFMGVFFGLLALGNNINRAMHPNAFTPEPVWTPTTSTCIYILKDPCHHA